MKIVQINATYGKGSTGTLSKDIHEQLKNMGHQSYVFWATACSNPQNDPNIRKIGCYLDHKLHALFRRLDFGQGFHSRLATKKLCRQLSIIQPDVVHLHNLHSNYIHLPTLYRYLQEKNIPTVLTLHDCWFFTGYCAYPQAYSCKGWQNGCKNCPAVSKFAKRKVEKVYKKKAEITKIEKVAFNGVSVWTKNDASETFLGQAKIKTHIYNWVDIKSYQTQTSKAYVYKKYGLDPSKKLILGVAQGWSMNDSKGGSAFCKMSNLLNDRAEIVLVGHNNGIVPQKGLHCIGYTANKQDLIDLYSSADLFVNPSRFETFGLVTIEAMACGTPVVAYNNTGSAELVVQGCGKLVEDGNVEELIQTVSHFLDENLEDYKERCISYVKENFDKITQVKKYAELYKSLKTVD
ncbi:MAG: glycosyltransferase [Clostridiales bacterium]|nr:glycosyltransferase [Clostridiales bacterium]